MNEGPQRWLYTTAGEAEVAVPKSPVVSYPFGQASPTRASAASGVSVEDPRAIHGRISSSPETAAAESEPDEETVGSIVLTTPWSSRRRAKKPSPESAPVAGPEQKLRPLAPMPQVQAIGQVRKHILRGGSGKAAAGRLVAERFSVGWIVYTPKDGKPRGKTYYVADDGELEETSSRVESPAYLESVEQRFWQRRAMFG
ncbi:hypothetical protein [Nocardia mexicana]|uniref:Uncharacterized protein n=1 Tax=Nocardia mexicana TaxID=279262 RepID=A0A370HEL9_9NOCA|nr:hypothetical protein [Nocardia mexicana]RDI55475.1 hypothetical protein DFR68_101308 [Nocardia mexicana]